jgi:hypothetical protein
MLGLPLSGEEMVGELKVKFVPIGQTNVELVQSTTPEGVMPICRQAAKASITSPLEVENID